MMVVGGRVSVEEGKVKEGWVCAYLPPGHDPVEDFEMWKVYLPPHSFGPDNSLIGLISFVPITYQRGS